VVFRVKGRQQERFELRWSDYVQSLTGGTDQAVGHSQPRLGDRRDEMMRLFDGAPADGATGEVDVAVFAKANALLDEVWRGDAGLWQRRLAPFFGRLEPRSSRGFATLVVRGCQPDALAIALHHAADVQSLEADEARVRSDIRELQQLLDVGEQALQRLLDRKQQFDEYLESRRLRVLGDEPGSAELKILVWDFKDWATAERADLIRLRRQTDRRFNPFTGHALVRLSTRIRRITGQYHDREVAAILNALSKRVRPRRTTSPANLRAYRARWNRLLEGRSKQVPAAVE
jgi:hypothetical protein